MKTINDFGNARVAALPRHLLQYIVDQDYSHYTALDQAVWRYVMRQNYNFLKDTAYYPYIPGLKKAGLTIEHIPDLQEMNDALGKIGWGAVTVDGFIPPSAFMEYQEYHVLVIAADIRQLKHIDYTPAPDIIHESSGHAPIIAEPDYNSYLSYFGSIGSKAMFSKADFELYEAIRELSIVKEMPGASEADISQAQERMNFCQENLGEPSEMALLSRLHWWTVEYGLIGTPENPKIYGAGLLSSIGESASCMQPSVTKLWYSLDAVNYPYDITKPQPQLFVTPDFKRLTEVLDEFADGMAFRAGGAASVAKAINSGNTATVVYSSGLQVSGKVVSQLNTDSGEIAYVRFEGPVSLAFENRQLPGHGREYHRDGFSSPVGLLYGNIMPLEIFTANDRAAIGLEIGSTIDLVFTSGVRVNGTVVSFTEKSGKLLLATFTGCTVTGPAGEILFEPSWGTFDMAVGAEIVSVFPGFADRESNESPIAMPKTSTYHPAYTTEEKRYHRLFGEVRSSRENVNSYDRLPEIESTIRREFDDDWLCRLEILEILETNRIMPELARSIRARLSEMAATVPGLRELITNGLEIANTKIS